MIRLCKMFHSSVSKQAATLEASSQQGMPPTLPVSGTINSLLPGSLQYSWQHQPPHLCRVDVKLDTRALWMARMLSITPQATVPAIYPRMLALHTLLDRPEVGCR